LLDLGTIGIEAPESRWAFKERSAGRFGFDMGFGVEEAGSATEEVETGSGVARFFPTH